MSESELIFGWITRNEIFNILKTVLNEDEIIKVHNILYKPIVHKNNNDWISHHNGINNVFPEQYFVHLEELKKNDPEYACDKRLDHFKIKYSVYQKLLQLNKFVERINMTHCVNLKINFHCNNRINILGKRCTFILYFEKSYITFIPGNAINTYTNYWNRMNAKQNIFTVYPNVYALNKDGNYYDNEKCDDVSQSNKNNESVLVQPIQQTVAYDDGDDVIDVIEESPPRVKRIVPVMAPKVDLKMNPPPRVNRIVQQPVAYDDEDIEESPPMVRRLFKLPIEKDIPLSFSDNSDFEEHSPRKIRIINPNKKDIMQIPKRSNAPLNFSDDEDKTLAYLGN